MESLSDEQLVVGGLTETLLSCQVMLDPREAFVICPISKPDSAIRERSDLLLSEVVEPILQGKYKCIIGRADHFSDKQDFVEIVQDRLASADLVVADLTGLNPNVIYELGYCHMIGIPVVSFIDSVQNLPSDLKSLRAIEYDTASLRDESRTNRLKATFDEYIKGARGYTQPTRNDRLKARVARNFGFTTVYEVHSGRRDHYAMAQRLVAKGPETLCLIQRSSTVLLGPEAEWGDEAGFFEALWDAIYDGTQLFHIASLDGITRHIGRPQSRFLATDDALARLSVEGTVIGVRSGHPADDSRGELRPIRTVPDESSDVDLKSDRQARAVFAEFRDEVYEAIIVMDLGGTQMSIHVGGPEARTMFYTAREFFNGCPVLTTDALFDAFSSVDHEVDRLIALD